MVTEKTVPQTMPQKKDFPFRKLSDSEWQEKREKGLCFRCDEKFTMGHRCKKKELRVVLVSDEEEADWEEIDQAHPREILEDVQQEVIELSLN